MLDLKRRFGFSYVSDTRADSLATVGTCAVLLVGYFTVLLYPTPFWPGEQLPEPDMTQVFAGPYELNSYWFKFNPFCDTRGQRLAHAFMVAALAVLMLLAAAQGPRWSDAGRDRKQSRVTEVLAAAFAGLLLIEGYLTFSLPFAMALFGIFIWGAKWLCGSGRRWFAVICVFVLLAHTAPALFMRADLGSDRFGASAHLQHHYSILISQCDRLAEGREFLSEVKPYYSVLLPVLGAAFERHSGPLSMGGWIGVIQAMQAVYLAAALFLFYRHARRNWALCLIPLLLVAPWYSYAQRGLLFPNQSAWRVIAMPLVLLAIFALRHAPLGAAACGLGAACFGAVLCNPETGVALSAGALTYLWFRYRFPDWKTFLPKFAVACPLFILGALTAGLSALLISRVLLGYWLDLARLPGIFRWLSLISGSGFGGLELNFEVWPALIFGHAVFVLIRTALMGSESAGFHASFRAAVAVVIVVWAAYYMNRPMQWNLASYQLLYGFLVIDLIRYVIVSFAWRRRFGALGLSAALALAGVILPAAAGNSGGPGLLPAVYLGKTPPDSEMASGVYIRKERAEELRRKAAFLRAQAAGGPVIFLTADAYLMPKLAGVFPALPGGDAFSESLTRTAYAEMIASIKASNRNEIYFDAPGTSVYNAPPFKEFYAMMKRDLASHYRRAGVKDGWEIWTRL